MKRTAAWAGQFYAGNARALKTEIEKLLPKGLQPKKEALGVMVPHAGYIYSGRVAASVYSRIKIPQTVVMVGPNHTGFGHMVSLSNQGIWQTPLGETYVDSDLAAEIARECSSLVTIDETAHLREHSLEVQLPFLQYLKEDLTIVPIALINYNNEVCESLGECIARAVKKSHKDVLVLASSDMTHYESRQKAEKKDQLAIKHLLALEPRQLLDTVQANDISMCGSGPAAVMLYAVNALGATKAELTMYDTSGTVSGDDQVVGYAGIIVS